MWFPVCIKIYNSILTIARANRDINRNAVDLAFNKHGGGTSHILVLHGMLGSKASWETIARKFAISQKSIVLAVDLRNHGESPHTKTHTYPELASDVNQLLDKENIKEATIIGHSMGGRTGMVLALTQPQKVKRLIVVDVSPISTPGLLDNSVPNLLDIMKVVNVIPGKTVSEARTRTRKALSQYVTDVNVQNFVLRNIGFREGKLGWMCNMDALKKDFGAMATFPLKELSGKVYKGPVLFIGGSLSNYIPITDLPRIQKLFPSAKLEYVQNSGHNIHAEKPLIFFEIVTKFLATH